MNLTMPVHLLYGENDPIAPPAHQGYFFLSKLIEGVQVHNLYVVPGTGRMPFFANTKDTFIDMAGWQLTYENTYHLV